MLFGQRLVRLGNRQPVPCFKAPVPFVRQRLFSIDVKDFDLPSKKFGGGLDRDNDRDFEDSAGSDTDLMDEPEDLAPEKPHIETIMKAWKQKIAEAHEAMEETGDLFDMLKLDPSSPFYHTPEQMKYTMIPWTLPPYIEMNYRTMAATIWRYPKYGEVDYDGIDMREMISIYKTKSRGGVSYNPKRTSMRTLLQRQNDQRLAREKTMRGKKYPVPLSVSSERAPSPPVTPTPPTETEEAQVDKT
eukprot:TRINITY_DN528_c0_g1_i1.p1 TRINITY_DN528_c0_g1~~TRINITY_DN528_c0_g1_i1.p1  ORF type:complete len:244 (-),score=67.37 TRINITY_DN528_c0_g1_i1:14-745(-)